MSRTMRRCCIVVLSLILLLGMGNLVSAAEQVQATYTAPDGKVLTSYSPKWDKAKLQALHGELMQNLHGDEMDLLDEIAVYDGYPHGKGVAGQYIFQTVTGVFQNKTKMRPGKIELYGGNEHTTPAGFAHTLAHEYGHHVTHYYTLQYDKITLTDSKRWKETTYAKMRGLSEDVRIGVSESTEHRWQLAEVAAEDYVQLFGSPLAKAKTPFESRIEQTLNGKEVGAISWNGSMFNIQPQENLTLPLASEVPGLYEFFIKQMKKQDPVFTPPAKPELKLASYSEQGDAGYQLHFTWTQAGEQDNYHYTLVTYQSDDLLAEPIVTREANDKQEALYGAVTVRKGGYLYTYKEPKATGMRHFKLYVFGQNGWVADSAVLTVDMGNPSEVQVNDEQVVPVEHVKGEPALDPVFGIPKLDFSAWIETGKGGWLDSLLNALTKVIDGVAWLLGKLWP
ncbi:hypothetical protein CIG75_09445 [Tumebacillus algifaecis]|uniref:Uncharacterized protein n=1 Tax=Tumebacillus algifaecis TaxID=1214604 RepID=A0A223D1D1_9BACL|nr:hypothetical protein [Tumebacillus algifaecis]ASS75184.1 hypothetical protein CIG75_09445 [Tumebacillus algifaecis]